ncbi:hypothetical protein THAOC_33006, partial [Thalassiosira oceanica]
SRLIPRTEGNETPERHGARHSDVNDGHQKMSSGGVSSLSLSVFPLPHDATIQDGSVYHASTSSDSVVIGQVSASDTTNQLARTILPEAKSYEISKDIGTYRWNLRIGAYRLASAYNDYHLALATILAMKKKTFYVGWHDDNE